MGRYLHSLRETTSFCFQLSLFLLFLCRPVILLDYFLYYFLIIRFDMNFLHSTSSKVSDLLIFPLIFSSLLACISFFFPLRSIYPLLFTVIFSHLFHEVYVYRFIYFKCPHHFPSVLCLLSRILSTFPTLYFAIIIWPAAFSYFSRKFSYLALVDIRILILSISVVRGELEPVQNFDIMCTLLSCCLLSSDLFRFL